MAMVVKNNMSAVRTLNTLNSNSSALQKSLQKVSSGMKINSAQDDASGYAISERMRVRIRSLDQANQNSQNDSSLMKTAEGAVGNTVEILRALKEKAINAANDSNTDEDRQTIQKEINQFIDQIDDNALVQFNGKYLVDGSKNNAFQETKSILLNQSLRTGTQSSSALTELSNRAGDSLGIQTTDQYQVSWVQNGTMHFTSGTVGDKAISDILNVKAEVTGADGKVTKQTFGVVKATGDNGLISGAKVNKNQFSDEPITIATTTITDVGGDERTVVTNEELISKLEEYAQSTTPPQGDGDSFDLNAVTIKVTDSDGNQVEVPAFGKSETEAFEDLDVTVTVREDADNNLHYELTGLAAGDEIYAANPKYVKEVEPPTPGVHTDAIMAEYVAFDGTATPVTGIKVADIPAALGGQLSTTATALSALTTKPVAGDKVGSVTIPDNAEEISWTVVDSNGAEVADGASYKVQKYANNGTDYFKLYDKDGNEGNAVGLRVAVKYTVPDADPNAVTKDNGLDNAADKFGKAVYTPDKTDGVAFGATTAGVNYQISGLTVSILDQDGNVKKAANAALDQFKQYQRAENKTGDMSLNFHIGSEANVAFKVGLGDMRAQALGLKGSDGTRLDVYTKEHANAAINVIENALTKALDQQTTIGAIEARLEYTSTNLTTSSENVQAAESTIRDADMAKEMTNYTKSNVLLQAAQAMLAQANQNSSAVLSLLQ